MRISTVAALASLATLISAAPLEKRVLVIKTVTQNVVETVDVYTTVVIKAGGHRVHTHKAHVATTPAVVVAPPVSTPSSTPVQSPVQSPLPEPTSSTPAPIVSPPAHVYTSAPVSSPPAPVSSPPAPISSPPAPVVSSPALVVTPPAPVTTPPAPTPTAPAPVYSPPAPAYNQAPSGGSCGEPGGSCSGDLTFYQAGLGSCGLTNDGSIDKVFALAHGMMEAQHATNPNANPLCGKMATIYMGGKSVVAKLVDTCANCDGQSVDLSNAAFDEIADENHGRYHDVQWHFN